MGYLVDMIGIGAEARVQERRWGRVPILAPHTRGVCCILTRNRLAKNRLGLGGKVPSVWHRQASPLPVAAWTCRTQSLVRIPYMSRRTIAVSGPPARGGWKEIAVTPVGMGVVGMQDPACGNLHRMLAPGTPGAMAPDSSIVLWSGRKSRTKAAEQDRSEP